MTFLSLPFLCPLLAATSSSSAIWSFLIYTFFVFVLAGFANRLLKGRNFLSEYFLGSRGLGVWAFALTFAATSASGGTFTGFPAKIYTHGWILALWIASYMVYPICTMGFLGKRINQVARKTGAITVPDILRDRFNSPGFGLLATLLIVFFLAFNLVAQFKAGSVILQSLIQDASVFRMTAGYVGSWTDGLSFFEGVNPGYLTCLILFGVAVIVYTTYGGFHAVVWTDVMQGGVMLAGVLILLPLILWQVGGISEGTRQMARMVPPRLGTATVELPAPLPQPLSLSDLWFVQETGGDVPRLFRLSGTVSMRAGETTLENVKFVEILTPEEIAAQLERLRGTGTRQRTETLSAIILDGTGERRFPASPIGDASSSIAVWPVSSDEPLLIARLDDFLEYDYGAGQPGHYISGPAPVPPSAGKSVGENRSADMDGFLPLGMAISFFFMWAISGTGQPQYMVRLMSFKDAPTLRRAIITVTVYYGLIYFPLVIIFCFSRIVLPGLENEADNVMPTLAITLTENVGHGWLAGLLLAAPFAAVMSTVDSFLLVISSALVRDVYQRNINPHASEKTIKWLCYLATLSIGTIALIYAINPPQFLQDIIVYVGSGLAACFLFPVIAMLYWPRANLAGCLGSMLAGFATHLAMHVIGWNLNGAFTQPYNLFGVSPMLVGLAASLLALLIITPLTPKPDAALVRFYFHKQG